MNAIRKEESDSDKVGVEGIFVGMDVLVSVTDGIADGIRVADGLCVGIVVGVCFSSGVGGFEVICPENVQAVTMITEPARTKRDNLNMYHLQQRQETFIGTG